MIEWRRSSSAATARHYARWCGDDAYRRPLEVRDGEVPADLLAPPEMSPESPRDEVEAYAEGASRSRRVRRVAFLDPCSGLLGGGLASEGKQYQPNEGRACLR